MNPGDLVRITPIIESVILLGEPPNSSYHNHPWIRPDQIGIVLERRRVLGNVYPYHPITWIKLLCSSGCGWVKMVDLEVV